MCAELIEILRSLIPPGIVLLFGVAATVATIGNESYGSKFWKCLTSECYRLKVLAILLIAVITKILIQNCCDAQAAFLGDLIMNLNSAIAGVYAGKGWLSDTGSKS